MALTDTQITGLNAASARKFAGTANAADLKNLDYAAKLGYKYTAPTSAAVASPVAAAVSNPEVTSNGSPAAPVSNNNPSNPSPAPAPINPTNTTPETTPAPAASPTTTPDKTTDNNQPVTNPSIDPALAAKPGIADLLTSGRVFSEEDAKNYAYAKGESNYQQYIGATGGATNPNYIGTTNWQKLQKTYTPYQLNQAVTRTNNGIYWKEGVNIGDIPSVDPNVSINADAKKIADIVSGAKDEASKFSTSSKKDEATTKTDTEANQDTLMTMLKDSYGSGAEKLYNELFNTDEIKNAQADVAKYKSEIDKYDQQLDELKNDITAEVEGEASDSYITALATVRGDKILKAKRSVQRDYDTAVANYTSLKENATNLLSVKTTDETNRYNRLFSMLQLQIQQEGTNFNQDLAVKQLALQIPEGRSMTIGDTTVTGLKEDDNINVVQFTAADGKTYVVGVDKKTGAESYKTYIGTAKVSGTGTSEKSVDLTTALYWLSLVKNKDGSYDLNSIPSDIRSGVVNVISQNKDSLGTTKEQSWWDKAVGFVQGIID